MASDPSEERGEYGAPAAGYRRYARAYNLSRLLDPKYPREGDTSFVAITLSTINGVPVPQVWGLYDAAYAREWWGRHLPSGIFYAALFDNGWYPRYPPKLVREYLHGGKWLGPPPP